MNRPYIICHMMMSIDGRIDCGMTEKIGGADAYYEILDALNVPSVLSGRVTAELEMAEPGHFVPSENAEIVGKECYSVKKKSDKYQIIVDTKGTLLWKDDHDSEEPLLIILSQETTKEYLAYLDSLDISWIVCGKHKIDLQKSVELLHEKFGVERLGVVGGGGNINGSFLNEGLLDEVSVLIGPGIDGRKEMAATFDGLSMEKEPFHLKLLKVESYESGAVWIHYSVEK